MNNIPTSTAGSAAHPAPAAVFFRGLTADLEGDGLNRLVRRVGDLSGAYADEAAWRALDAETIAYTADLYLPVEEGRPGGLYFGNTRLEPGLVGDEYAMTKGHFHAKRDAAEYYWCVAGQGALILMDEDRRCRAEAMSPGSLHYIPGRTAHRVANTGDATLVLGACWPSDAGHDYETIAREGFSARLRRVDGRPTLVPEPTE
ncbi:MAG: glucose-6-phosphate isomerase family protein [Planctomycetota bacterium]